MVEGIITFPAVSKIASAAVTRKVTKNLIGSFFSFPAVMIMARMTPAAGYII